MQIWGDLHLSNAQLLMLLVLHSWVETFNDDFQQTRHSLSHGSRLGLAGPAFIVWVQVSSKPRHMIVLSQASRQIPKSTVSQLVA